jgi:hypothetical protein
VDVAPVFVTPAGTVDESYYAADGCGWMQLYKTGDALPERAGVDLFLVARGVWPPRMAALPGYGGGAPPVGSRFAVVSAEGVVCVGSVSQQLDASEWELAGCDPSTAKASGAVALRASSAAPKLTLRYHYWGDNPPDWTTVPSNAMRARQTVWNPYTAVELDGRGEQRVEVWCRRAPAGEFECERYAVQRLGGRDDVYTPVARARWTPPADVLQRSSRTAR